MKWKINHIQKAVLLLTTNPTTFIEKDFQTYILAKHCIIMFPNFILLNTPYIILSTFPVNRSSKTNK